MVRYCVFIQSLLQLLSLGKVGNNFLLGLFYSNLATKLANTVVRVLFLVLLIVYVSAGWYVFMMDSRGS